jgi:virginiamycin B lyase
MISKRLHLAALGAAAIVVASSSPAVADSISITESATFPTPVAGPCEIHFDSSGIGWVEEVTANKIGRYDPATGSITDVNVPTPLSLPGGEAIGTDGGVWFTEMSANKIARLDPQTEQIQEFTIPIPGALGGVQSPIGVAYSDAIEAGSDNAMWFTEIANNAIGRIDLTTHVITSYPIPTPLDGPIIIHRGPGNTMIFPATTADKIGQLDIYTHQFTEYSVPTPAAAPQGVTTAVDGTIWFTETAAGKIGRIDPVTHQITEWSLATSANLFLPRPGPLVFGSDGKLYVAEGNLDGGTNIGQFDPATHAYRDFPIPIPIPTPAASPCDLNSHGNSVFFGELLGNRIGRLTIGS